MMKNNLKSFVRKIYLRKLIPFILFILAGLFAFSNLNLHLQKNESKILLRTIQNDSHVLISHSLYLEGNITRNDQDSVYLIYNDTLQYLSNCYPCGDFLDLCSTSYPSVPWSHALHLPKGKDYQCNEAPESLEGIINNFKFSDRYGLVAGNDSLLYFAYNNTVKRLISCGKCGPIYDICEEIPFFFQGHTMTPFALSRVGYWAQVDTIDDLDVINIMKGRNKSNESPSYLVNKAPIFLCDKDIPTMIPVFRPKRWLIITPPHVRFMAKLIANALQDHNEFSLVEILVTTELDLNTIKYKKYDIYIVLCANIYKAKDLPPSDRRMVVQLEQQSSHWFTDEYIKVLRESYAVLEYNINNLIFLQERGITVRLWHLPLGADSSLLPVDLPVYSSELNKINEKNGVSSNLYGNFSNEQHYHYLKYVNQQSKFDKNILYDLIFFGDIRCERRQRMLKELKSEFSLKIVTEKFGAEMHDLIKKARFVINIHFYMPASLEVFRLYESLSLGVPVISEDAPDSYMYPDLKQSPNVYFFDLDSTSSMIKVVRKALLQQSKVENYGRVFNEIRPLVETAHTRFLFYFTRVLLGMELLPVTSLHELIKHCARLELAIPESIQIPMILSVPESPKRRMHFLNVTTIPIGPIFDGTRHLLCGSWMASTMSYRIMAQLALNSGIEQVTIAEDYAIFPLHFNQSITIIEEYLGTLAGEWDIFGGLVTDLHTDTEVLSVIYYKDVHFVTINKMVSLLYNIYNTSILQLISKWDPLDQNVNNSTLDQYINRQNGLKIVVMIPFLVQYGIEENSRYSKHYNNIHLSMIRSSELKFVRLVNEYLSIKAEKKYPLISVKG